MPLCPQWYFPLHSCSEIVISCIRVSIHHCVPVVQISGKGYKKKRKTAISTSLCIMTKQKLKQKGTTPSPSPPPLLEVTLKRWNCKQQQTYIVFAEIRCSIGVTKTSFAMAHKSRSVKMRQPKFPAVLRKTGEKTILNGHTWSRETATTIQLGIWQDRRKSNLNLYIQVSMKGKSIFLSIVIGSNQRILIEVMIAELTSCSTQTYIFGFWNRQSSMCEGC